MHVDLELSWEEDDSDSLRLGRRPRQHRNDESPEDDAFLWFNSRVRPSDVVEATKHLPKYEYTVTGRSRIKPGSRTTTLGTKAVVNGKAVAIFQYEGEFYAIQNACPHQAAPLHLGDIEDLDGGPCVACPRHKWPFSLEDGHCIVPINVQAECYPVRIRRQRNGVQMLHVGFVAFSDCLFSADDF